MADAHRLSDAPLLCDLLDRPIPVHVSTVSPLGHPQASLVWTERRGDELAMFFEESSIKARNIEQNPRVSVIVVDDETRIGPGVPVYAQLSGLARVVSSEPDLPDRMARAYGSPEGYSYGSGPFVTVLIDIRRISGLGPLGRGTLGGWAPRGA